MKRAITSPWNEHQGEPRGAREYRRTSATRLIWVIVFFGKQAEANIGPSIRVYKLALFSCPLDLAIARKRSFRAASCFTLL